MPKILILIHDKRLSMNEIIINKESHPEWKDWHVYLLSQFLYCQIFVSVGVTVLFNIPAIIISLYFVKHVKNQALPLWNLV